MSLKWTDTLDIAIELSEQHDDVDPQYVDIEIVTHNQQTVSAVNVRIIRVIDQKVMAEAARKRI